MQPGAGRDCHRDDKVLPAAMAAYTRARLCCWDMPMERIGPAECGGNERGRTAQPDACGQQRQGNEEQSRGGKAGRIHVRMVPDSRVT